MSSRACPNGAGASNDDGGITSVGTSRRSARSRAPTPGVSLTQHTTSAGRSPASIASRMAWTLVPPPEAKTARRIERGRQSVGRVERALFRPHSPRWGQGTANASARRANPGDRVLKSGRAKTVRLPLIGGRMPGRSEASGDMDAWNYRRSASAERCEEAAVAKMRLLKWAKLMRLC